MIEQHLRLWYYVYKSITFGDIMNLPKRKINRLANYNYSTPNAYFITICTVGRKNLLWDNVGEIIDCPEVVRLSEYGIIVDQAINNITSQYSAISVDHYVIMPNHVHLLLQVHSDENGCALHAPTISTVVQQMKGYASKHAGIPLWQKGFYDHVIRGDEDYLETWKYIEGNPMQWGEDQLCKISTGDR